MTDPRLPDINSLFLLSFENGENYPKKVFFEKYYI